MEIVEQIITDIGVHDFDFSGYFRPTSTISAISVAGTSGLVELSALRATSGQIQYLFVDVSGCTAGLIYTLACQATGSAGEKRTLYKTIRVVAEPVGISAVPATGNVSGLYSAVLAQAGTAAPTVTAANQNSLSGTPTHGRTSKGVFTVTLAGAFLANKVTGSAQLVPLLVGNEASVSPPKRLSDNVMEYRVYDWGMNLTDEFGILYLTLQTYT